MTTRRIAPTRDPRGNLWSNRSRAFECQDRCGSASREDASSGCILLQELYGVADRQNGLCRVIGDLAAELLLEGHDQLDSIEAVGPKVVDEARVLGDLVGLDSEMLHHDLLYALRDIAHPPHRPLPCHP